jgi:hypothetical protein
MKAQLTLIVLIATLLQSCNDKSQSLNTILIEAPDASYFGSKNWVLLKDKKNDFKKYSQSGSVDINLYGFKINTKYFIKDSIVYLSDEGKNIKFLDFRMIECNSYKSVNGNSIKLLKFYPMSKGGDNYYFYLFKMPYSIVDYPEARDRFIIYASLKKGIIGVSDFLQDSSTIRLRDYYIDKQERLIDSSFNTPCL